MKRFKNILLAYDGKTDASAALTRALDLARTNEAVLTVLEVVEDFPGQLEKWMTTKDTRNLKQAIIRDAADRLRTLLKSAVAKGVQVNKEVLVGKPFLEIIRSVLQNGYDLVIVTPRGRGGFGSLFLGSTTRHLMRKCPVPVWAVKQTKKRRYRRILAAVDPSPFHSDQIELSRKIMELAASLAESERAELHVVHCWSAPLENALRNRSGLPPNEVDKIIRETRATHKLGLDTILKGLNLDKIPHRIHLRKGDPVRLIVDVATKKRMELVVMGTVSRKGLPGVLIGNTAEKVLDSLGCSVLTVKPDGFVSPVTVKE